MKFHNQVEPLSELQFLSANKRHTALIEGPIGCGKTYLAKQYANMLHIIDFQVILPKVDSVRDVMESCCQLSTPIVLCFENLDSGTSAASYALLKFLEEPTSNIYIVVTCRNVQHIPDTIISRSAVITVPIMQLDDLEQYASYKNSEKFETIKNTSIWKSVRSIHDIDTIFSLTPLQMEYLNRFYDILNTKESVSNIAWKLQKFPDGSKVPIHFAIQHILCTAPSQEVWLLCHECLQSLYETNISSYAVIAKFVLKYKYCFMKF